VRFHAEHGFIYMGARARARKDSHEEKRAHIRWKKTKGPSHIARHKRNKTARDGRLSDGAEALYARSPMSYGSALKIFGTKLLLFHRRFREEETRCLPAPPWTPMLFFQSDCPPGPNQTNSVIGRTGSTNVYVAAE